MISLKSITLDHDKRQISIKDKRVDIDSVVAKYEESRLFSYLEIATENDIFLVRGFKSIWECLRISTYDVLEKREDNKVYNLYCQINDSKND